MAGLNPYRSSGPFGVVLLAGKSGMKQVPGILVSIDGARTPEEWAIQKPINASNAVTVWRGRNLAEAIVIVTNLYDEQSYDDWEALAAMLVPADPRSAPPILNVINPWINSRGITKCGVRYPDHPKPAAGKSFTGELSLIQYRQRRIAKVGPPDAPPADSAQTKANKQKAAAVAEVFDKIATRGL
jgi:hypothetical protein